MGNWRHRLTEIVESEKRGLCAACGPVDLYYRRDRQSWMCAEAKREQRGLNKNRVRLGLRPVDISRMLDSQEHMCSICSEAVDSSSAVDHCHASGRVRAILCRNCNLGLGNFRDNPAFLVAAADYVTRHSDPAATTRSRRSNV